MVTENPVQGESGQSGDTPGRLESPPKQPWRNLGAVLAAAGTIALVLTTAWIVFEVVDAPGRGTARWEKARADMGELQKAVARFALDHGGSWPATLADVAPMFGGNLPRDPYTRADFRYARTASGFVLTCLGKDGAPGGAGPPDADIVFTEQGEAR